jgi:WD40 repeat protein
VEPDPTGAGFKYWAFLSYSHQDNLETRKDGERGRIQWAEWLHDALENYRVPAEFRERTTATGEPMPDRFFPVFQDEKELPINADLGESIRIAVRESRFLIVVCSPRAAVSRYVNEEVRYFKTLGRQNRIMTLMVDGEPNASFGNKQGYTAADECFCPALRHPINAQGEVDTSRTDAQEPIAGDVRIKEGSAPREATQKDLSSHRRILEQTRLKLVAGLMGVGFDELIQRDKDRQIKEERARTRRLRKLAAGFAVLALVAAAAGFIAFQKKQEAQRAQAVAESERSRAESERSRAESALARTRATLSRSDFLQALRSIDDGKTFNALAQLARSLSLDPANQAAACRLITLLTHHDFALPLQSFKSTGPVHHPQFTFDARTKATAEAVLGKAAALLETQEDPSLRIREPGEILHAAFSPNGKQILALTQNRAAQIWDGETGRPLAEPFAGGDPLFSPDGKIAFTTSGEARFWDPTTGKALTEPLAHSSDIISAQFSPDGALLITGTVDGTARVWDTKTGQPITGPLKHDGGYVRSVEFSPDGTKVLTAAADKTARIWNAQTGAPLLAPLSHEAEVDLAHFSSNGKRIVTAAQDGTVRVWDAEKGAALTDPISHEAAVRFARLSPDGTRLVTGTGNVFAQVWDVHTTKPTVVKLSDSATINSAQFSPDGKKVVTATSEGTVQIWWAQTGTLLSEPIHHEHGVELARFSDDNKRVITLSVDGTTKVWDVRFGAALSEPLKHEAAVESAQFSRDGKKLVTAAHDNSVRVWDVEKASLEKELFKGADAGVMFVTLNPDGQMAATVASGSPNEAQLWSLENGQPVGEKLRHEEPIVSVDFTWDSAQVVTASKDGKARIWDTRSATAAGPPLIHENPLQKAVFSPDGKRIVTVAEDKKSTAIEIENKKARVWDVATRKLVTEPFEHDYNVFAAHFSPDGRFLMTLGASPLAPTPMRIWEIETRRLAIELKGTAVWAAEFSSDGKRFAAAMANNTAQVFELESGKPVTEAFRHGGEVKSARFDQEGRRVITASDDKSARIWDVETGKALSDPLIHKEAVTLAQFSPNGRQVVTASGNYAYVRDIAPVADHVPDWLLRLAEAVAGQQLNDRSVFEPVLHPNDVLASIRTELAATRSDDDMVRWGRWFLADRNARSISPFSSVTLPQYIEKRLQEKTPESLAEAEWLAAGNAGVLKQVSEAKATLPQPESAAGKMLEFNGGEIYYTRTVTEADVRKLGDYMVKQRIFEGTRKTMQLNKTGSTYEIRAVVKKGTENSAGFDDFFKTLVKELRDKVFKGSDVVVHLCDDQMKTLRVISVP